MDRVRWADGRDLLIRAIGPAVALCALILGLGLAVAGPLSGPLDAEDALNAGLAARRTAPWDTITLVWSYLGSTEVVVGVCLLFSAVVLWRTHDWRLAAVPAIAILLQLAIYLTITALISRARPSVDKLDVLPPMTSFPSGHVGAATALYVTIILIVVRIARVGPRWMVILGCVTVPLLVGFARLYRGMHHLSDIAVGLVIGVACALLAYGWYSHRAATSRAVSHRRQAA